MKRLMTLTLAGALLAGAGAFAAQRTASAPDGSDSEIATCVGASPCRACKNCRYCGLCAKRGGKCGACTSAAHAH